MHTDLDPRTWTHQGHFSASEQSPIEAPSHPCLTIHLCKTEDCRSLSHSCSTNLIPSSLTSTSLGLYLTSIVSSTSYTSSPASTLLLSHPCSTNLIPPLTHLYFTQHLPHQCHQ